MRQNNNIEQMYTTYKHSQIVALYFKEEKNDVG